MSFRYSIFFFHDEQSWNVKILFRDFENSKKIFARRATSNSFFRHNVFFDNKNQIDSEQFETKLNFLQNEMTIEFNEKKNDDVTTKRENFKKITQKQFYVYMLQVSFRISVSISFSRLAHFVKFFAVLYSSCFADTFSHLKSKKKNTSVVYYIRNDYCSISSWTSLFVASSIISIEFVKINNDYELIVIEISWIA